MKLLATDMVFDFETKSDLDLSKVGSEVYSRHPSTKILFMTYRIGQGGVRLWTPGNPEPDFSGIKRRYAHNIGFDYKIWHNTVNDLSFFPLTEARDSMAIAGRFTFPDGLGDIGKVMGLKMQKEARGKELIKMFSIQQLDPNDYPDEWEEFEEYGIRDTASCAEMIERLPYYDLTPMEQELWMLTYRQNERGLPIDVESAKVIYAKVKEYQAGAGAVLDKLTRGVITKHTQTARIKKWCNTHDFPMDGVAAPLVAEALEKIEKVKVEYGKIPPHLDTIKQILEIRRDCGKTSTAKYEKMIDGYFMGRVHDFLQYYGARATGRWAGRGIQPHNFVRKVPKDPEEWIKMFMEGEDIEDPVGKASMLCRSMIKAREGKVLLVADYSSIENRVLAWLAYDHTTLKAFREGFDQYKDMASFIYSVPYEEVTDDQRQFGKMVVLGCGFGMGWKRFKAQAFTDWGMLISDEMAQIGVKGFRKKYKIIVDMWYTLAETAQKAVRNPGVVLKAHRCKFKVVKDQGVSWLRVTLPSGRALMYCQPEVGDGKYGDELKCYRWVSHGWRKTAIIPGLITENIVQAIARDIMSQGLLNIEEEMPEAPTLFSLHDEGISEIDAWWNTGICIDASQEDLIEAEAEAEKSYNSHMLAKYCRCLCRLEPWMTDLPLSAEGYVSERFKKG